MKLLLRIALLSIMVAFSASCASSSMVPLSTDDPLSTPPKSLALRPGDVIALDFVYHPELNVTQSIRPDGKVSLKFINEVQVAGLSPEEVRRELLARYSGILRDPEITVTIESWERYVYVGGEIAIPAGQFPIRIPYVESLTALKAILQSGGVKKQSAELERVLVIRRIGEKDYARTIDLTLAFTEATREPFYLAPDDIVFVPRTKIDLANQWVDQYMNKMVPDWISANLGYTYVRNKVIGGGSTVVTVSP